MYAITETEHTREIDFEFADGSYFAGNINIGVYWDGGWELKWAEGILRDADDNECVFKAYDPACNNVMRMLNSELAFRRHATDWADEAIREHKDDLYYDYKEPEYL